MHPCWTENIPRLTIFKQHLSTSMPLSVKQSVEISRYSSSDRPRRTAWQMNMVYSLDDISLCSMLSIVDYNQGIEIQWATMVAIPLRTFSLSLSSALFEVVQAKNENFLRLRLFSHLFKIVLFFFVPLTLEFLRSKKAALCFCFNISINTEFNQSYANDHSWSRAL